MKPEQKEKLKKIFWKLLIIIGWSFFFLLYLLCILWCFGALCYAPMPLFLRIITGALFLPLVLSAPFIKPRLYFLSGGVALILLFFLIWSLITPTNQQIWVPEYARLPLVEWQDSNRFRIRDIRDFHYTKRDVYQVRYDTEEFDLTELIAIDYIVVYWEQTLEEEVAHVMLRFRFSGGRSFLVSAETRRTDGAEFGGVNNLYKQTNLIYVVATDRDVLAVRTNARDPHERVYIYETDLSPEQRIKIFRHLADRINAMHTDPEFYNTLTNNCFMALLPSLRAGIDLPLFDFSYFATGLSDRAAFEGGLLKKREGETFEEMKARGYLNPTTDSWDFNTETYHGIIVKWDKENGR